MFSRCKLVHGDFSEYNLLWFENEIVVIDVSQSVEWDHPRATEFLRKDCANVRDFFSRKCERVLSVKLCTTSSCETVLRMTRASETRWTSREMRTVSRTRKIGSSWTPFYRVLLQDLGSWPEAAQRAVVSGENENGFDEAVGTC